MGRLCYAFASGSSYLVPSAVKCVCYITVGGGGGGAYPNVSDLNRPGFNSPTNGGSSCVYGVSGTCGGGGNHGNIFSGGRGGRGNFADGQTGVYNNSGPNNRARSGYGPYGSGGAGQWRSPNQSYGGGGGGASSATVARGSNGANPGQRVFYGIGAGGRQGGSGFCRYGNSGAVYATVCTYDPPVPSINATPTSFRLNGSDGSDGTVDLTWSTTGGDSTTEVLQAIQDGVVTQTYGQVGRNRNFSNPFVVSPTRTTTYRLTTSNPAFSNNDEVTVSVYLPPVVNIFTQVPNNTIIRGESIRLYWTTTGDADTLVIDNGVGPSQLNSDTLVSPSVSTLYTATASGLGGVGSDDVFIEVLQPPTLGVSGPVNVLYGQGIPVSISATNVPGGITYTATYTWTDGTTQTQSPVSIPNSSGDEIEILGYTIPIAYDGTTPLPLGPASVFLYFEATGYGTLSANDSISVPIIIDETPDMIDIPESDDKLREENPVITPESEVTTQQLVVTDIDIPVEIKADLPVQVELDNSEIWQDVRQI